MSYSQSSSVDDKSTASFSVINPTRKLTGIIEEIEHSIELVHSPKDPQNEKIPDKRL